MELYWNITLIFIYNMLCKASLILDMTSILLSHCCSQSSFMNERLEKIELT